MILTHSPRFTRNARDELPSTPKKLDTADELLHQNPQTLGRKNVSYIGFGAAIFALASGLPLPTGPLSSRGRS
jgi:hypothetical protein